MKVQCLVCGQWYEGNPIPQPPSHFWTCSDQCQHKFLEGGGLEGRVRSLRQEPEPRAASLMEKTNEL